MICTPVNAADALGVTDPAAAVAWAPVAARLSPTASAPAANVAVMPVSAMVRSFAAELCGMKSSKLRTKGRPFVLETPPPMPRIDQFRLKM